MAREKPTPGMVVSPPGPPVDTKGIVKEKGKNLAGTPRSGGIHPREKPGSKGFKTLNRIKGV